MNATLLLILLPVFIIPWVTKLFWPRTISWIEIGSAFGVGVMLTLVVYFCGIVSLTHDVEILNGQVTSKSRDKVSCRHSYQCHCHPSCSGSGKSRSCSEQCDTCYEHSYDVDWVVHSSVQNWDITTIDRQGLNEPPRWTQVKTGDPVSTTHSFTNYVKAVPESLFHANLTNKFDALVPEYPDGIYDYYKLNRAIAVGVPVPDISQWNADISDILRTLGPSKQANVIVIFVNTSDESYLHALEGKWIGGKKNDIIVVLGVTKYPKIDFVAISSWTDAQLFKVQLRDDITAVGTIDRVKIIQAIQTNTAKAFQRKHMKDFEYLQSSIEPPTWVLILAVLLGIISSIATTYFVHRNMRNSY
jgi:hypothetical protein